MQKGNYVDVITRKASNTLNFLQRNLSRPTVRNEQSKQLISHWFDPSWNMMVLSGTNWVSIPAVNQSINQSKHICKAP